jgi:hypothetical protein
MRIVINESGRIIAQANADLRRQADENVVVISRDPAKVTNLAKGTGRVCYLGPWGSTPAYLAELAA